MNLSVFCEPSDRAKRPCTHTVLSVIGVLVGEKGREGQDATKICTECGLSVHSGAAVCERCGNVFKKLTSGQNDEVNRNSSSRSMQNESR